MNEENKERFAVLEDIINVGFTIERKHLDKLNAICKATKMNRSAAIRRIIELYELSV